MPPTAGPGSATFAASGVRGLRLNRIVAQSEIRRPDSADYHSGYEAAEGYAPPQTDRVGAEL